MPRMGIGARTCKSDEMTRMFPHPRSYLASHGKGTNGRALLQGSNGVRNGTAREPTAAFPSPNDHEISRCPKDENDQAY